MPLLMWKKPLAARQDGEPFAAIHALQTANARWLAGKAQSREQQANWAAIALQKEYVVGERKHEGTPLLATCMNPNCNTNWFRPWRNRRQPMFEGQWACSPECMRELIERAVQREMGDNMILEPQPHHHRLPLGLVLLSQGWITLGQLRTALHSQRTAGKGRIGAWLIAQCGLTEEKVTRALCMQWGCPMFSLAGHQPSTVATLVPRLLLDTYGILPLRVTPGRTAYLAFEDRIDAVAAHAVGRMNGLRTETGLVAGSQYLRSHEHMMAAVFPRAKVVDVADTQALAMVLTEAIERIRPQQARLVRMHKYFWLRLWHTEMTVSSGVRMPLLPRLHQVEDLLVGYEPTQD